MNMSRVDPSEQIRYVQCGVCRTILLVNVPYNNLSMVVSVRCGNCTCLLSVNMAISSFIPLHLLTSLTHNLSQPKQGFQETEIQQNTSDQLIHTTNNIIPFSDHHENDADAIVVPPIPFVNKPPEKKQRAPSAYNQFIKEEIRRLKSENPRMPHKEAFKTAAKNWAHLPPIHGHGEGERSGRISSKHRPQNYEAVTKPTLN